MTSYGSRRREICFGGPLLQLQCSNGPSFDLCVCVRVCLCVSELHIDSQRDIAVVNVVGIHSATERKKNAKQAESCASVHTRLSNLEGQGNQSSKSQPPLSSLVPYKQLLTRHRACDMRRALLRIATPRARRVTCRRLSHPVGTSPPSCFLCLRHGGDSDCSKSASAE